MSPSTNPSPLTAAINNSASVDDGRSSAIHSSPSEVHRPKGDPIIKLDKVGVRFGLQSALLRKKHKEFWALKEVSFELFQGEALGVIGSNGAGKSTLMKVLAGIYAPDRGTIWVKPGLHISLLSLGLGFESSLNGQDNAVLAGMLLGHSKAYMQSRLDHIKDYSELGDFFYQPIYTYSSGMLSRLGFSVAMEANPEVLLIDEAMSVGDAHFQEKSGNTISERLNAGKTIVLITHSFEETRKLCTRAVWIDRGSTITVGSVDQVFHEYEKATSEKEQEGFVMKADR